MKALLVGEDNPYGADPRYALWCEPRRSAGGRLCYDILGIKSQVDYVRRFDRTNLCLTKWSDPKARNRAIELMSGPHEVHVLLGSKVTKAYGFPFTRFSVHDLKDSHWPALRKVVVLPHPSGRNTIWNDPAVVQRARDLLVEVLG